MPAQRKLRRQRLSGGKLVDLPGTANSLRSRPSGKHQSSATSRFYGATAGEAYLRWHGGQSASRVRNIWRHRRRSSRAINGGHALRIHDGQAASSSSVPRRPQLRGRRAMSGGVAYVLDGDRRFRGASTAARWSGRRLEDAKEISNA